MVEVIAGIVKVQVSRAPLKRWLELEKINEQVSDLAGRGDAEGVSSEIVRYLVLATGTIAEDWMGLPWMDVAKAYSQVRAVNDIQLRLPILQIASKKMEALPWEYPGREWYTLAHVLAAAYSWSLDAIAELDVEDAFALLQEILVDEQLDKEWVYGLSEIAYPYNKLTKKQDFKPLQRPEWMQPVIRKSDIKKVFIKASMLPVGNVIRSGLTLDD